MILFLYQGFNATLNKQKADAEKFREQTGSKFSNVDNQLKTQRTTADKQKAALETLKSDTAGRLHVKLYITPF